MMFLVDTQEVLLMEEYYKAINIFFLTVCLFQGDFNSSFYKVKIL